MTHYARHDYFQNRQNGALSSDTGRSNYSHIPYETQKSSEYFRDPCDLRNQGPDEYISECHLTSDLVPRAVDKSNNSYGYDNLECYGTQEQLDLEAESVDNWNENTAIVSADYGFKYANQKCNSSKILPTLPVNTNGSGSSKPSTTRMDMDLKTEGMWSERNQRHGVCMARAQDYDHRLLPGDYQIVNANNLNGYAGFAYSSTFLNNAVPAAPTRALPQKARSSFYLSQDLFELNADAAPREDLIQCSFGIDQTVPMGSGSTTYDVLEQMSRPYTSMLPLDYSDYQECYNNTDNLSTYSDTPPTNNAQLKLQKQRKISLMMAMTTASVIASGETRVPVHSKHSKKPTEIQTDSIIGSSISTNAVTKASDRFLEPECCGGIVTPGDSGAITSTQHPAMATISKTRKLPKVLPTPQFKSSLHTNTTGIDALGSPLYSSDTISEKSHRPKQLPKVPTSLSQPKPQSIPNSNFTTYSAPVTLSFSSLDQNSSSPQPPATTIETTTTTYSSIATSSVGSHKSFAYPYNSKEPKDIHSIEFIKEDPAPSWTPSSATFNANLSPSVDLPYNYIEQNSPTFHLPEIERGKSDIKPDLYETSIEPISESIKSPEPYCEPDSALFNISEYLKPYTLDIITFSGEKPSHITNAASTSTTTQPYYDSGGLSSEMSKLHSTVPLGDGLFPNSNTWATSCVNYQCEVESGENISTQPNKSTVPVELTESPLCNSIPPLSMSSHFTFDNSTEVTLNPKTGSPPDITTTVSSITSNNAFTTTVPAKNLDELPVTTSQIASPTISTLTVKSPSSIAPILSYTDYMKQFELPDLPQLIMDFSENESATLSDTDAIKTDTSANAEMLTFSKELDIEGKCSEPLPSYLKELFDAYDVPSFPIENHESPVIDEIQNVSDTITVPSVPITTIVCSVDPPNRPNFKPEAEAIENNAVSFDDTFYDSFNVDIIELTASVAYSEAENGLNSAPILSGDNNSMTIDNKKSEIDLSIKNTLDTRDMNQNLSSAQGGYYKPSQTTQQKTNVVASAATSVLGGISKGLKGGLDGVFSGVGSTVDVTQTTNTTKKGFSFNLASKLVPSVGGLLSSSSSNASKQTLDSKIEATPTAIMIPDKNDSNDRSTCVKTISPSCLYKNTEDNLYATTFPNTLEVSSSYNDAMVASSSTLMGNICENYDESYDELILTDEIINAGMLDRESEYGLIENPYLYAAAGEAQVDNVNAYKKPQKDISNQSSFDIEQSKIRNDAAQFHESPAKKVNTTSGGMFGSILGKAAAAVQSATQAVNQSASSVASVVAQKPSMLPTTQNMPHLSGIPMPNAMDSKLGTVGFDTMNIDYTYQLPNEELLPSHYANAGQDYENSNIKMDVYSPYTDNKAFANYNSNGNQSQFKDATAISGQYQEIANGTKILPTVPPAGSTGKKLPTVNGKSGLLIKQMPTEIYDDESELDELDVSPSIGKEPGYRIDSEQDDYYMDLQPTTPSNQTNGYYEHVNNGYDYREDYFNEEDEYKYLEQQREQEQQHQPKNKKYLKQTKGMLPTSQPQSSLDFIDEGQDNDFIYENYHSEEDSGKYLDESSSGSVGPIEGRNIKMDEMCVGTRKHSNGEASLASISTQMKGESFTPKNNTLQNHDGIAMESTPNLSGFGNEQMCPDLNEMDEDINDQLSDINDLKKRMPQKKKPLLRGETEEVVAGHMQMIRQPEITARQRWHWAYNKIIMQLNIFFIIFTSSLIAASFYLENSWVAKS